MSSMPSVSKHAQSSTVKKPHSSLSSQTASQKKPARANHYTTLPQPTTSYIRLRFQLCCGSEHVYRVVLLPLSYTFANLHTLILFLFGWDGGHLHQSHVYSHVKMKKSIPGIMSKYGTAPPLPEWIDPDDEREVYFWELQHPDSALYEVVPERSSRHTGGFEDYGYLARVQDQELTVGQVWSVDRRNNASHGECANTGIGIKYEYDLGESWLVHITCPSGDPFSSIDPPSNMPIVASAKGAPPIEDPCGDIYETEPGDKRIMPLLFSQDSFELYCQGVLFTRARKNCLAVFNVQEEGGYHDDDEDDEDDEDVDME